MPSRKPVPTLKQLCLTYVSSNIDVWSNNRKEVTAPIRPDDMHQNNDIAQLPITILDDIIRHPDYAKNSHPHHVSIFINRFTARLDFSGLIMSTTIRVIESMREVYCANLTYVKLTNSKVDVDSLKSLAESIPSIKSLRLRHTRTNDDVLKIIGNNCPNLLGLDVGQCDEVTDIGITALCVKNYDENGWEFGGKCRLLRKLIVSGTSISSKGALTVMRNVVHLCEFDYFKILKVLEKIYDSNATNNLRESKKDFDLVSIYHRNDGLKSPISNFTLHAATVLCKNVTKVVVTNLENTDNWILQLVNFPNLTKLSLLSNYRNRLSFEKNVVPLLDVVGKNLKYLHLFRIEGVNLWDIGVKCNQLEGLHLCYNDYNSASRPTGVNCRRKQFGELRKLDVICKVGKYLPSDQLKNILFNCQYVKRLKFHRCQLLSDRFLSQIFECNSMSKLKTVSLAFCNNVDKSAIGSIMYTCNSLKKLNCKHCKKIQPKDVQSLRNYARMDNLNVKLN